MTFTEAMEFLQEDKENRVTDGESVYFAEDGIVYLEESKEPAWLFLSMLKAEYSVA